MYSLMATAQRARSGHSESGNAMSVARLQALKGILVPARLQIKNRGTPEQTFGDGLFR